MIWSFHSPSELGCLSAKIEEFLAADSSSSSPNVVVCLFVCL